MISLTCISYLSSLLQEGGNATTVNEMISDLVPGLVLHSEAVSLEEEKNLVAFFAVSCENAPDDRVVKQYGHQYDYKKEGLGEACPSSPPLEQLADRFRVPQGRQTIVNKYEPGQGISPHFDNLCFGPSIWSLSLGDDVTMILQKGSVAYHFWLPRRSLLVLSGEARYEWNHSIEAATQYEVGERPR